MPRSARVIVLCEDLQHRAFCVRLLKRMGFGNRDIRPLPVSAGSGDGYSHVRDGFAGQVLAQRRRAGRAKTGLLTMVDADTREVAGVMADLDGRVETPRTAGEGIALLIPKRNIETWIAYLGSGQAVNETDSYPKLARQSECHPAADRFHELARGEAPPADCPPSLRQGLAEYPRLAKLRE